MVTGIKNHMIVVRPGVGYQIWQRRWSNAMAKDGTSGISG